jgi:hypothetical protein
LESINEKLNDSFRTITEYKTRLSIATRWVFILGGIFVLGILAKIAGCILYAKRIPVPRILDILL